MSSLLEKMEQQGAGQERQKWSIQGSLKQTEHLWLTPSACCPQKIQEFSATTVTWEREAVVAFCWGENGQEQNGSAVARQGLLPVTITNEYFLIQP